MRKATRSDCGRFLSPGSGAPKPFKASMPAPSDYDSSGGSPRSRNNRGVTSELAELRESPLGKLKAMVDEASARGKDLVSDMVKRLKRDIMAAQNRLDAMRSHPR